MKQYLDLLKTIQEKGTKKPPARENMPGSLSLFGHQMRFNLQDGFPILTTKKISIKNVITELLWFLRGDTNIKYLIDNGCNIWNEDAYNYYKKVTEKYFETLIEDEYPEELKIMSFKEYIELIKNPYGCKVLRQADRQVINGYRVPFSCEPGTCGEQYGKLWRNWEVPNRNYDHRREYTDQLCDLIEGLEKNPEGRRHILTSWNPATLDQMALNACHILVQFNCRPLSLKERVGMQHVKGYSFNMPEGYSEKDSIERLDNLNIPKYYLDCQLYQRSADVFLGVPYNITSYSLLTELLSKICNMIPGEFIHTFGDVHIYDNHVEQVEEQLKRTPGQLPKIHVLEKHREHETHPDHFEKYLTHRISLEEFLGSLTRHDFRLEGYESQETIKAELSTGLVKTT